MKRPSIRRIAGWLGADGNPLRRRIDRVEVALRVLLVLGFVVAVWFAVPVAGRVATADGMRQVRQESSWRQVAAVLLKPAPPRSYGYGSMATYWVPARWHAPSGAIRKGNVPTRTGVQAGSAISIWVNRAGRQTGRRPMTASLVGVRSVLIELLTVASLAAVVAAIAGLIRWLTNRRRIREWGLEWACFGPRWTTRRWPRN
jgi:hypothetical protein